MISVIIPTYNGSEMLCKSLPTWFEQSLPKTEYEVIVVDNGSTDDTRSRVEKLIISQPNVHYLYESARGATAARHAGAHKAKGEYLVFADNDGLYNHECLASILDVFRQNSLCVAVACKIEIVWDEIEPDWIAPYKYLLGQLDYGPIIEYNPEYYLNGGLMSVRKDVFERLGGFNPDLIGRYLIGDGDLGFVNKLHAEKAVIGWTPYALMRHMQVVAKHGTKRGVALHFYNNGIADSYAKYRGQHFKMNGVLWRYLFVQLLVLCKKWVELVLHAHQLNGYFALQQHKGTVRFFVLLLKPNLRKEIKRNDLYND